MRNDGFPCVSERETPFRLFSYAATEWMELHSEITQQYKKLKLAKQNHLYPSEEPPLPPH